jgi:imidazolonepropionase-like amidohydrolase
VIQGRRASHFAEMLRLEKSIGLLEAGCEADLIVVQRSPLEDILTSRIRSW